jgi:hypothetical protein
LSNTTNYINESIIEDLIDPRSDSRVIPAYYGRFPTKYRLRKINEYLNAGGAYLTPRALQHFDFSNINDEKFLGKKVYFMAM